MARKPETPGVDGAIAYARDVIKGRVLAGRYVIAACQRFLDDLTEARAGRGAWEFREGNAESALLLASLLVNIKGPLANHRLAFMGWQQFVYANLFGFYERGTDARRFRQAVVYVPRGNGKTTFAAPLVLYMTFAEGEGGAEGYAAAVTRGQARILFDTAQEMVRRSPGFRSEFGVNVTANSIHQIRTASKFVPVSSDAKALDGLNVHVAVCDEIASHKTSAVYDVLLTAMGKRLNPLLACISTATANNSGIGRNLWNYAIRVLEGAQKDDRLFAVLYAADDEDDIWDERTWEKANPSWGVSVQPDAIRAIAKQARQNPAQEAAFKTRHLNIWVGSENALFLMRAWRERADTSATAEQFAAYDCHIGLDLASKTDLASLALTFSWPASEGHGLHYATFSKNYVNETAVLEARHAEYPGWAAAGHLIVTPGNETDFGQIELDLIDLCARFRVQSIAYDPWAATQLAQRMIAEGLPMVEFRATTQNFSEPTKELDAAMQADRIVHDGNPVLDWCISNVVGHLDPRGNVFPRKERPENKIDAAVATIMTIGRSLAAAEEMPYADGRGMLFL